MQEGTKLDSAKTVPILSFPTLCPDLPPSGEGHRNRILGCQTCQDPGGHEVQPPNFEDGENEVRRREEMTQDHTVNQNPRSFSSLPLLIY